MTEPAAASDRPAPESEAPRVRWYGSPDDPWTTTDGAAAYLGRAVKSLANDRTAGRGVPFLKPFGRVRYRRADLEAFLAASRARSTAEARYKATRPRVVELQPGLQPEARP